MILLGPISPLSPKSPWALALEVYWVLLSIESYFPTDTLETQGSMEPLRFVVNGAHGALEPWDGSVELFGSQEPHRFNEFEESMGLTISWVGEVLQVGRVPRI